MESHKELPADFIAELHELEAAYLRHDDLILQSGFGGGAERWRSEREPILDGVKSDGDILDIGCANGYLAECLVSWGHERGLMLTPYGLDQGEQLIELARKRLPDWADNFLVGNAWNWNPPRKFQYVYCLNDCVPENYLNEFIQRLLAQVVEHNGRLILGAYGSRSRGTPPFDIEGFLKSHGYPIAGVSRGGSPPITAFAWVDAR